MQSQASHALLVVGECGHGLALAQVPQLDCLVMGACDDLHPLTDIPCLAEEMD